MAEMIGADVQELRALANQFTAAARTLDNAGRQLTPAINRGSWQGPDASRFRNTWNGTLQPRLSSVAEMLRQSTEVLRLNADEQEHASGSGGSIGSTSGGSGGPGGLIDSAKEAWSWVSPGKKIVTGLLGLNKLRPLWSLYSAAHALSSFNAAAASAKIFLAADMADIALGRAGLMANMLGKLGPVGTAIGRWAGPIGGLFAIGTGINDMFNPAHDGWRGVGDRIAGGLSVVGGAGTIALALGAGAALGPIGIGAVIGAGVVAGAWTLGNMIYDNREAIGDAIGTASTWIADQGRSVVNAAGNAVSAVGDALGTVGSWTKGLFSW